MANTYTLIASNTLGSSAASVTFSSIPSTYTDLVLKVSARNSRTTNTTSLIRIRLNSNSGTVYSFTRLAGDGSSASSANGSAETYGQSDFISTNLATSNTFGNGEIYIPNYAGSSKKQISSFGVSETNATTQSMGTSAILADITSAITSITVDANTFNFVSGSSFWLYGISSS